MNEMGANQSWIISRQDQINYLDSLDEINLKYWILNILDDRPFPIWIGRKESHEYVDDLYQDANSVLKAKIEEVVSSLIRSWKAVNGNELAFYLIYLAGRIRAIGSYQQVLLWVHEGRFKNVFVYDYQKELGRDLHKYCLMAIGPQALPGDLMLYDVCRRDIEIDKNPRYFALCYRILFSNYADSKAYLIRYFPTFINLCMSNYYSFVKSFYFIFSHDQSRTDLVANVDIILNNLSDDQTIYILRKIAQIFLKHELSFSNIIKFYDVISRRQEDLDFVSAIREYRHFLKCFGVIVYLAITNDIDNKILSREFSKELTHKRA